MTCRTITLPLALLLAAPAALAQQDQPATLATDTSEEYEQGYLTTADGRALYMFTLDERGTDGTQPMSHCENECAEAWPPLLADGTPKVGQGVEPDLIGTVQRPDGGAEQVTYAGWPLYRYFRDQSPEFQTHGQALETHGGYWYLIRPDGQIIEDRDF